MLVWTIRRAEHPAYGYFTPQKEYFDAIIRWQEKRNGVKGLEERHIGYANGVLAGVVAAANVLCSKGDNILVHSPTYVGFTHCLEDNGYNIVHSPLVIDENNVWRMDYADMEEKIVKKNSKICTSTVRFFARPTIPAAECGSAGSWKRPWPFSKNTMCM